MTELQLDVLGYIGSGIGHTINEIAEEIGESNIGTGRAVNYLIRNGLAYKVDNKVYPVKKNGG